MLRAGGGVLLVSRLQLGDGCSIVGELRVQGRQQPFLLRNLGRERVQLVTHRTEFALKVAEPTLQRAKLTF